MAPQHAQIQLQRAIGAPRARVFRAWRDASSLQRWYLPGDDGWTSSIETHDFRPGGGKRLTFGPAGEPPYAEDCRNEDIRADERIVYTMTILRGEDPLSASIVTVEFVDDSAGTQLTVTEQMTAVDGEDSAADRERGWGEVLDKLEAELAR